MQHQAETRATNTKEDAKPAAHPAAEPATTPRLEEYPEFERDFDLPPGIDLDAATGHALRQAQEVAAATSVVPTPLPGAGCPVPAKLQYTREEGYQIMQWEVHRLRKQVREFQEQQKQVLRDLELRKKQPAPAAASPNQAANSA
jgi:hypothetical protein